MLSGYSEYQLLLDYKKGIFESVEQAVAAGEVNDSRQINIGILYLFVFIISGIVILRWIHRANYNVRQLGAKNMVFTPGWSIGYYFIPIVTLWKPYQAMKEIWQTSQNLSDWTSQDEVSNILPIWWATWIVTGVLGRIIYSMSSRAEDLDSMTNLNLLSQISDFMDIPLALILLKIVNQVYSMQKQQLLQTNNVV